MMPKRTVGPQTDFTVYVGSRNMTEFTSSLTITFSEGDPWPLMRPDPNDRKNMYFEEICATLLTCTHQHTRTCRGVMGSHVCMECSNLFEDPKHVAKMIVIKTVLEQED
jgi:hypothetical protein